MASLEDLDDLEQNEKKDNQSGDKDGDGDGKKPDPNGDADMKDADKKEDEKKEEEEDLIDMEILNSSTRDIIARRRLIENDTRIMKSEFNRLNHEKQAMNDKIKDNVDKIENNR
jgi:26S proteasome regulatory subunit T5